MKKPKEINPSGSAWAGLCGLLAAATCFVTDCEGKPKPDSGRSFRPPSAGEIRRALKPEHPRLMLNAAVLADVTWTARSRPSR